MDAAHRRQQTTAGPPAGPWAGAATPDQVALDGFGGRSADRSPNRSDRLPWPLAVPLIAVMSLACWFAVWKGSVALLALLAVLG